MKQALSSLMIAALVWTCPGLAAYTAAGETAAAGAPIASLRLGVPMAAAPAIAVQLSLNLSQSPASPTGIAEGAPEAQAQVPAAPAAEASAVRPMAAEKVLESSARQLRQARGDFQKQEALDDLFARGSDATDGSIFGTPFAADAGALRLVPSEDLRSPAGPPPSVPSDRGNGPAPQGPRGSRWLGALATLGRWTLFGAAVVAAQRLAVAAWPAAFGLNPLAAVWAVSSAAFLLPAALYSRRLLAKHDSARLKTTKWAMDAALGALGGALLNAATALPMISLGHVAALSGAGLLGGAVAGLSSLTLPSAAALGAGAMSLGPILGMAALPMVTTISFFLKPITAAAESGRAFVVPGSMQKIRFPAFSWIMLGAVFALMSGYGAVHPNWAFAIWALLGKGSRQKAAAQAKDEAAPVDFLLAPIYFLGVKFFGEGFGNGFSRLASWLGAVRVALPPWAGRTARFVLNFDALYLGLTAWAAVTGF